MADFNFIVIPELRQGLESDYKELQACLRVEAWKAVHVLAGSIVEAVLIDALSGAGVEQSKLDSMELAALIGLAKQKGILADEAVDLSIVIRKYRNLIHPGRVKRLEKKVDRSGAVVSVEVVDIIAKQVADRKQQTYGYTAEQLLERLRGGSSALPLVAHLLKDTPKPEIERLLIDLLPNAYANAIVNTSTTDEQDQHLLVCYRSVFDATDHDVRTRVTKSLYKVYRTQPETTVLLYEDEFFRPSDLAYLSDSEAGFIKAHFLPRVIDASLETLGQWLPKIAGIGPFLEPEDTWQLSVMLIGAAQGADEQIAMRARTSTSFR